MALSDTNLLLQIGKLPLSFRGTPQQLVDEILRRAKIVSPSGISFIFTGDVEPSSNVGPWFRTDGQIFVFDEETKRYTPLVITDSETRWYWVGPTTPPNSSPALWLKTRAGGTAASPLPGSPIGFYQFDGAVWRPFTGIPPSGPTSARPAAPQDFEEFWDTDIACALIYERGAWRTRSGSVGDIKHTVHQTLTEALRFSPGWELYGSSNSQVRGRYISQATKDPGASPATDLTVPAGVAPRAAGTTYGESDEVDLNNHASGVPYPPTVALWTLVKV